MGRDATSQAWWNAGDGEVHSRVFEYVQEVERVQADLFERFAQFSWLYDPHDPSAVGDMPTSGPDAQLSENVIASNVDSAFAAIAATEVRARFLTDDGDWSLQRQARHLEWYTDGLGKLLDLHELARIAFKDCAKKGTGFVKIYVDWECKEIRAERVLADDIIFDLGECRAGGKPRQMHQRRIVDREELKAQYPDAASDIDKAQAASDTHDRRYWAGYRPIGRDEVVVLESWRLPYGKQGSEYYRPGRHTICTEGHDIFDEEFHKASWPIARIVWSERDVGPYGIGLAERIVGHQRVINKANWQTDKWIDRHAFPTTWVRQADANLAVKTYFRGGGIGVYKAEIPKTDIPVAVSPEVTSRRHEAKDSAYEETGMSRLAATARKPAGLESGVALREYRDQTTQRFAQQEKAFERHVLDLFVLALDCCKDLGADAPAISHRGTRSYRKLKWAKVDMGDVRVQISAASNLSRTSAGRAQQALEWAQAGLISTDSAREALVDLDNDAEISLYRAAQENIDGALEDIIDGEIVTPEPYDNLALAVWRGQQRYLKERRAGCPEEILEGIRTYVTQAAHMKAPPEQQPIPESAPMQVAPDMAATLPEMAAPQAALAPEAMQLMAQ